MANVDALAKRVAEGAITIVMAIEALTGFNQTEIQRLISQAGDAMDRQRKEEVMRANDAIERALQARNWTSQT